MIERLHGILVERHPTFAVIECGGVGYGVQISARTGERLPAEGTEITLLTHLVVREDAMELFGFADTQEKELFLSMITVTESARRPPSAFFRAFPRETSFRSSPGAIKRPSAKSRASGKRPPRCSF
jgi:hypothetical protein